MFEFLERMGLPLVAVAGLGVAIWAVRELLGLITEQKAKLSLDVHSKILQELDTQLEEFYLPVRERFRITRELRSWAEAFKNANERYDNSILGIESDNPRALRDIVVRGVFLPLNREVKQILLEKQHLRQPSDETDYGAILRHLTLWEALEEAKTDGSIKSYDAEQYLRFPAEEGEKQNNMCVRLLAHRAAIRERVVSFSFGNDVLERRMGHGKNHVGTGRGV